MGLMLSILVFCVGVIEALSCYEHFQYGVIHYATNIYENTRRRSSLFLTYASGRLKLLSEHSLAQHNENSQEIFQPDRCKRESVNGLEGYYENSDQKSDHFTSVRHSKTFSSSKETVKKLDKKDKINIVKSLLEKPRKQKVVRSISMPELIYTERDIELTNIINNLAIEPIEEVNIEIEDVNSEVLTKEFDRLFEECEINSSNATAPAPDSKEPRDLFGQNTNILNYPEKTEKLESNDNIKETFSTKNSEKLQKDIDLISEGEIKSCSIKTLESSPVSLDEKGLPQKSEKSYKIGRSTSVDFIKFPSIRFNKSLSEDLDISSYFNKKSNVSSESDDLLAVDESVSCNRLDDAIFENDTPSLEAIDTTFEEIYNDVWDESSDLANIYEEIEKNVLSKDFGTDMKAKPYENNSTSCVSNSETDLNSSKEKVQIIKPIICGKTVSNDVIIKAAEQLAELIIKDSLNLNKIKSLIFQNLTHFNSNEKLGFAKTDIDNSKQCQFERNTAVENALGKSECNVEVEGMKNFNESKNGEEKDVSQNLSNAESLKENPMKIFPSVKENDLTAVRHEGEVQKIDSSILVEENSNSFNDFTPEITSTADDYPNSSTENVLEKQKLKEKSDFPVSSLESSANTVGVLPNVKEIIERNLGGDTEAESLEDFIKSANKEIENSTEPFDNKSEENGVEIQVLKTITETENHKHNETDIKKNESENQKVEDLMQREHKSECEGNLFGFERGTEIQSGNDVTYVNSDPLSETIKTSTSEVLLIPESKEKVKSEENKNEITEQKAEQDIGNKNLEELQSTDKMEFIVKETLGLHEKAEETEESVESEQVGKIGSNLSEVESEQVGTIVSNVSDVECEQVGTIGSNLSEVKSEQVGKIGSNLSEVESEQVGTIVSNVSEVESEQVGTIVSNLSDVECEQVGTIGSNLSEVKSEQVGKIGSNLSEVESEQVGTIVSNLSDVESEQVGTIVSNVSDVECEQVGTIGSNLSEVKSEQVGTIVSNLSEAEGTLSSEESHPVSAKDTKPDFSRVNLSSDSSASGGDAEVKRANSAPAPEAFWLIFSGEYTKAMSKDWHSGHFSCWQCDEALTGQRYVLRDDHPYCIKCYESVFANVCEECNKIIGIDSKDLSYKDKHWHEACFLCNKCRVSLVDKQFGSKADKIYCGNCYDAQFASRCDGCGEIFRAGTKKMEYKTRQWHEKCFCCCVCKTPIGTKSFIPREQEIYCATCYEEKFATRCVKCNKIITSGGVTYKNEPWHRECFTCTNCNTSLAGQRFTSRDEKPYCAECFGELFAKRCTACSKPITGIGGTRFISFEDRHWHNDCFICASCKTSLVGRGFITDGDDIICPECAKQKLM